MDKPLSVLVCKLLISWCEVKYPLAFNSDSVIYSLGIAVINPLLFVSSLVFVGTLIPFKLLFNSFIAVGIVFAVVVKVLSCIVWYILKSISLFPPPSCALLIAFVTYASVAKPELFVNWLVLVGMSLGWTCVLWLWV